MRAILPLFFLIAGATATIGCGEPERPAPPEGYVDPGTDPGAMDELLPADPSQTAQ